MTPIITKRLYADDLAARGKSQTTTRAALFHQLCVAKSRNIPDISPIWRLDLAKNGSLSIAEHFCHGLLELARRTFLLMAEVFEEESASLSDRYLINS